MSFISYAQNFEDVMIWRALKHVENGFYIDVGANDPTLYSVTRAFYDKGWQGINLEPVSEYFQRLVAQRPRDINLQIGAGQTAGSFPFFDIPDTGLATSDPAIAEKHRQSGWQVRTLEIPVLPLSEICREHAPGEIHFLKIDVEGAEKSVLLGMDFKQWRPWLMIVEATVPMSQQTVHQDWEPLLDAANYDFVYFDGLNRYYIAQEHPELKPAFATPPNVFDGFVLNADQEAKMRVAEAEAIAHHARQNALAAEHQAEKAAAHAAWAMDVTRAAETTARIAEAATRTAEAQTGTAQAQTRTAEAETRAAQAETRAAEAETDTAQAQARAAEAALHTVNGQACAAKGEAEAARAAAWAAESSSKQAADLLASIYASTSWRITRPLRGAKQIISASGVNRSTVFSNLRSLRVLIKKVLLRVLLGAAARPQLRILGQRVLARWPGLEKQIKKFIRQPAPQATTSDHTTGSDHTTASVVETAATNLPASARRAFVAIQRAIGNRNQ